MLICLLQKLREHEDESFDGGSKTLLLTGLNYSRSHSICVFFATAIYYCFIVAAFWMNVMCFDVARAFASSFGFVEAGHTESSESPGEPHGKGNEGAKKECCEYITCI
jgi:hypothetical protein